MSLSAQEQQHLSVITDSILLWAPFVSPLCVSVRPQSNPNFPQAPWCIRCLLSTSSSNTVQGSLLGSGIIVCRIQLYHQHVSECRETKMCYKKTQRATVWERQETNTGNHVNRKHCWPLAPHSEAENILFLLEIQCKQTTFCFTTQCLGFKIMYSFLLKNISLFDMIPHIKYRLNQLNKKIYSRKSGSIAEL